MEAKCLITHGRPSSGRPHRSGAQKQRPSFPRSDAPITTSPPLKNPKKKHTECTDGRPRGGEGKGGRERNVFSCVRVKADLTLRVRSKDVRAAVACQATEQVTEQCIPPEQGVRTLSLNMFFSCMCLSFALALWWSLVLSAGLGFVLVPLMDPDWSWGAGRREGRAGETGARCLRPPGGGVGGRKRGAAGEVGAPVQVSGGPSSLTNFEIDLRPAFPRCTGAERSALLSQPESCF